ncbi:hypothetical protein D3C74_91020 [compost metagenome]
MVYNRQMMQMFWKKFLKDEKGDGVFTFLFIVLISMILMLLAVSIFQSYAIGRNLNTATSETLSIMKFDNGADSSTEAKFRDLIRKMGMDPNKVSFYATPKTVQRGETIEVKASYTYKVFALKAIGVDYEFDINSYASGFAHKFIR